jgi:hypothetical protein
MYNSQVIPQCLAYKAVDNAAEWQVTLLALDLAAAGTCAAGCAGANLVPAVALSCQGLGAAASISELVGVFAMSSSVVGSAISGVLAVGGGATTALQLAHAGDEGGWGIGRGMTGKIQPDLNVETGLDANGNHTSDQALNTEETRKQKDAMCGSAVFYTALGIARGVNFSMYKDKLLKDSCKKVQDLASDVLSGSAGDGGQNGDNNPSGYHPTDPSGSGGGGTGTPGSGGTTGGANNPYVSNDPEKKGCTTSKCDVPEGQKASTDGSSLTRSGLDKAVSPKAPDIASAFKSGGTGAATQAAFGGLPTDLGSALATLAAAVKENPESVLGNSAVGSGYSGGGGSGGGGSSKSDANPFANLFGAKDAGGMARGPADIGFGSVGKPMDIWHTGTHMNLFEIVSDKVSRVANRVGVK